MPTEPKHILPFADPVRHKTSAAIIQKLSSNTRDIRDIALGGIALKTVQKVLDLGCGFGFMSTKIAEQTLPSTKIIGIDIFPENKIPFLASCSGKDSPAEFYTLDIMNGLPWEDDSFSLIVCSYSLYFFVEALPEIARVLTPDGCFIVITHSEHAFQGLYSAAGIEPATSPLSALLKIFSAENGCRRLSPFFENIEKIPFDNRLCFTIENREDLLHYVQFKLPLLIENSITINPMPDSLKQKLIRSLQDNRSVIIDKTDAVFRCRGPRCR